MIMNFKPSKFKIIFCLIILFIFTLLGSFSGCYGGRVDLSGKPVSNFSLCFSLQALIVGIIPAIVVYIIWSLIEKKK